MSSRSCRSLSALGFPFSGILDIFSNKIVCRQDKCLPRSDFSLGGPFVERAGIQPSSANGLEIYKKEGQLAQTKNTIFPIRDED